MGSNQPCLLEESQIPWEPPSQGSPRPPFSPSDLPLHPTVGSSSSVAPAGLSSQGGASKGEMNGTGSCFHHGLEFGVPAGPLLPLPYCPSQILLTPSQHLSRSWRLSGWFYPNPHREVSEPSAGIPLASQGWRVSVCLFPVGQEQQEVPLSSTHLPACASSDPG